MMSGTQTTLKFTARKNIQNDFNSTKCEKLKESVLEPISADAHIVSPKKFTPKVKKIVELDSDDENIDLSNIRISQRKVLKRKHCQKSIEWTEETSDESDCSPTKISRTVRNASKDKKYNSHCKETIRPSESVSIDTPGTLPARNEELAKLTNFLSKHLEAHTSGSLYISGPPGTGKTACLTNILEIPKFKDGFSEVYVNCTVMKSPGSIYNRICQELRIKTSSNTEKGYLNSINKYLSKKHKMILLVLDEIDQLCTKNQGVLYTIFEWPTFENSKIVLIGIANALDLTDRVLPRLQCRSDLKPQLMHFVPYSKQQIIEIFTDHLKKNLTTDLFSPTAIQMLAGKVAAVSGDVRRALDIGKRVIEMACPRSVRHTVNKKPIELKQVMNVLNDVYGASQRLEADVDDSFPLQQKILICSLLLILNKGKNKDVTVGKLHEVYKRVCTKRNIAAVDSSEFYGLCDLIQTRGIIRISGRKDVRLHKVFLQWDESEVTGALKDKKMISEILIDVSCL